MRSAYVSPVTAAGLILVFAAVLGVAYLPTSSAAQRPDQSDDSGQDAVAEGRPGDSSAEVSTMSQDNNSSLATFGAGCFWGVEAAFRQIEGVKATQVGYAGGRVDEPSYQDVCSGTTGHAEVVQVEFDPAEVSYDQLLKVFWESHDPTQVDRQGPDIGEQYRSVIFFHSPEQETQALESKASLEGSGTYSRPIATRIEASGKFWRAEDYHQQYLEKRGLSTCRIK